MSVTDSILKTIDYAIDKKTRELLNVDESGIVLSTNTDGTYKVLLQGEEYDIPNGSGIPYKPGSLVWVHSPNGNFNKKFIIAARTSNSKQYNNSGQGIPLPSTILSEVDFATVEDIDALFE